MDNLNALASAVGQELKKRKNCLATAESCTGGGVAQAVTEIPGSSDWFDCGFVTYSNASKTEMLGISEAMLAMHGAVSEEIAAAMAEAAVANSNATVGLSTTGIAGPGGAVPGKPVGTVCFGWKVGEATTTERRLFTGDRQTVREQAVAHSLKTLLRLLEKQA